MKIHKRFNIDYRMLNMRRTSFQVGDCDFCTITVFKDGSCSFPFRDRFESFHDNSRMCAFCQAFALYAISDIKIMREENHLQDRIEIDFSFDAAWIEVTDMQDNISSLEAFSKFHREFRLIKANSMFFSNIVS